MAESIERLFEAWKASPTVDNALAVCDGLERSRTSMFSEIAESLLRTHALDGEVQLRVGEVFLSLEQFDNAYNPILTAGKLTPREPGVYRVLGEALLRQGDPQRAARVFERAVELAAGIAHDQSREWLARANAFVPLQKSVGARAVRTEVARRWFPGGLRTPVVRRILPPPVSGAAGGKKLPGTIEELAEAAIVEPATRHADYPAGSRRGRDLDPLIREGHAAPVPGSDYADEAPTLARREVPRDDADFDPPTLLLPKAEADVESFLVSTQHQFREKASTGPLDILRAAGMLDPEPMETVVAWVERRSRRRGAMIVLGVSMALAGLAGGVLVRQAIVQRAEATAEAQGLVEQAETLSKRGDIASLDKAHALTERANKLAPDDPSGWLARARVETYRLAYVESSKELATLALRAQEHGAKPSELAFAEVASRVSSRDFTRALELITEHDASHKNDPAFQWTAGLALLRAGDPRATQRFERASEVDPDFGHAEMMRTLLTALTGNADAAFQLARSFRVRYPDRPEGALLAALAYTQHANVAAPPELDIARTQPMTGLLGFVPIALTIPEPGTRAETEQTQALDAWIRSATAPPLVALGLRLARERGLHTTVASVCASRAPLATRSRAVCASSLLLLGRQREARALIATAPEADPSAPDVTIARALYAYERLDAGDLAREVTRLGDAGKNEGALAALRSSLDVLRFRLDYRRERALELADRGRLWGDLIAIDSALDAGDVDTASVLLRAQSEPEPAHWVRQLRLARLRGDLGEATALAQKLGAIEDTPRAAYERIMLAVAKNETRGLPCSVVTCVNGRVDPLLGAPFAQAERCLLAYARPESNGSELARGVADDTTAFTVRLACALAMAKTHHPKAKDYARSVLAGANADVRRLGELLSAEPTEKPTTRHR